MNRLDVVAKSNVEPNNELHQGVQKPKFSS